MKDGDDSDHELHAWVDGQLDRSARAAVEARLARDPEAAQRVAAWTRQREQLLALHARVREEPVPAELAEAAHGLRARAGQRSRWLRVGGMAAALVISFGIGWVAHGRWAAQAVRGGADFARQAAIAHVVYVPEVRHPVEVEAAQHEHLVQWLSRRLQRPLNVPDLQPQGYRLVGGRLLPGASGPRAQFMYERTAGERITLYVGAVSAGSQETAFRYAEERGVGSFYWMDQGFGYALTGSVPRARLLGLAQVVHRQL